MGNKATGMGEKEEKGRGGKKTTTRFHHRGPGEAERMLGNDEPLVTLPVKRLRALLMAASPRVSSASLLLPLSANCSRPRRGSLERSFSFFFLVKEKKKAGKKKRS